MSTSDEEIVSPQSLIEKITAAEGKLRITAPLSTIDGWIAAARAARRLVPQGWHLEVRRRCFTADFNLLRGPHPMSREYRAGIQRIEVAERLTHPHPVVKTLQSSDRLKLTKSVKARAMLLLNALASEAERRDYVVEPGAEGYAMTVMLGLDGFPIKVSEQDDRVPHVPTATEIKAVQRNSWTRIPEFDAKPSGRLVFELEHLWGGRQYRWADGKRARIEDRLADILIEIETRAVEAAEHRAEVEERRREKEAQWALAMAEARLRYEEHYKVELLNAQIEAWNRSSELRRFCKALEKALALETDSDRGSGTREWIEWITSYANSIDPPCLVAADTGRPRTASEGPSIFSRWLQP